MSASFAHDKLIDNIAAFVKTRLKGAEAGHDWFHVERVWKLSKKIQAVEGGNLEIIELGALLHDIADPKFYDGDEKLALEISSEILCENQVSEETASEVLFIIKNISFKNRQEMPPQPSLELQIVQDADRLDAIGAIGIARTFNFGGFKNNIIYNPSICPKGEQDKTQYMKADGTTINHFYEKLLLLKDMMNTPTAKNIALLRHQFMERFLEQFYREWDAQS